MKRFFILLLLTILVVYFLNNPIELSFFNVYNDTKKSLCVDTNSFIDISKNKLLNREEEFEIELPTQIYNELINSSQSLNHNIIGLIYLDDDKSISTDGDYLERSIRSINITTASYPYRNRVKLSFQIQYSTTLKQEEMLLTEIEKTLDSLDIKGNKDYDKVKKIHDFIVEHMAYDLSLTKHSAYDALFNQSGVCEAYTLLAYRMFLESNIDCKIITGSAGGDSHAWNIVNVDGKWYNIDLTWDDPITSDNSQHTRYDYFLKNDNDFYTHEKDLKFYNSEFINQYPIAKSSYNQEPALLH